MCIHVTKRPVASFKRVLFTVCPSPPNELLTALVPALRSRAGVVLTQHLAMSSCECQGPLEVAVRVALSAQCCEEFSFNLTRPCEAVLTVLHLRKLKLREAKSLFPRKCHLTEPQPQRSPLKQMLVGSVLMIIQTLPYLWKTKLQ